MESRELIDWSAIWLFAYGLGSALVIGVVVYLIRRKRGDW